MIVQSKRAEAAGDPAQTFTGRVWIAGMRIGRTHNFAEQNEPRVGELVFLQDRIEGNVFAVMTELAIGHVKDGSALDLRPIGIARQKNKLRLRVDKFFD